MKKAFIILVSLLCVLATGLFYYIQTQQSKLQLSGAKQFGKDDNIENLYIENKPLN